MIYEKKWVKREEKKMSIKSKNIIYSPYIETKLLVNELIRHEAESYETSLLNNKLANLALLEEAVNSKLAALAENLEKSSIEATDTLAVQTTTDTVTDTNESTVEEQKAELLIELQKINTSRQEAHEVYTAASKENYSSSTKALYSKYYAFFKDFDLWNGLKDLFLENTKQKQLIFFSKVSYPSVSPIIACNFNLTLAANFEEYLFFWNLKLMNLIKYDKVRKLRLRRWRLKKRKLRKLYAFKKIKRFMIFKKFKKLHFKNYTKTLTYQINNQYVGKNILIQKIPVSERLLSNYNLEFFYKLNKFTKEDLIFISNNYELNLETESDEFLVYLRNYHQKPYWKFRKARITHWNLFFKKTIRKQRYKTFLKRFMKQYHKLFYTYTFLFNFFTKFKISWTRLNKFSSFWKNSVVECNREVLKLPLFFSNFFNWKLLQKRSFFLKKKIGRWSFLNFKRANLPWLQRKKTPPKAINHVQPNCHFLKYLSYWDPMTGYLQMFEKPELDLLPVNNDFKTNYLVKLHMYRYKSNKKCTSL